MASGNTLCVLLPRSGQPSATAYATMDFRGTTDLNPVLDFDDGTQETIMWTTVLPRIYSGSGITVYVTWSCTTAITGTVGWLVAFDKLSNLDALSFASDQTIVAATVPGTTGNTTVTNVAVSNGANIDNIAVGDAFVLRVRRNTAVDTAVGDAELSAVELKET